jgi:flagellar assembly factor FliW
MSLQQATAPSDAPASSVDSAILGALDVGEDQVFRFPRGILGFPTCHHYVLLPADREGFFWLQSVDCGSLAFLLVDPFEFVDGFFVDLGETDLVPLEATDASEMAVLAIVTLPSEPQEPPTANLQGVLAFNFSNRIGRQVIVQDSPHGTRWPLDPQRLRMAS